MQRRSEAKHCSSLCSQSEGANFVATKQGLKIQQSHTPERWSCSLYIRGPHFASKVSYNAGAATDECAAQRKSLPRGCRRQPFIFPNFTHLCLSANLGAGTTESGSRHNRIKEQRRPNLGAETTESGTVFAKRHRDWSESHVFPLVSAFFGKRSSTPSGCTYRKKALQNPHGVCNAFVY